MPTYILHIYVCIMYILVHAYTLCIVKCIYHVGNIRALNI